MEQHGHGCACLMCKRWRLRWGALFYGFSFCSVLPVSSSYVAVPMELTGVFLEIEQAGSVPIPHILSATPSATTIPPKNIDSQPDTSPTNGLVPVTLEYKADASGTQGHGAASEDYNTKPEALLTPLPPEGAIEVLSDQHENFVEDNSKTPKMRNEPEEPLSVAERVRRRFHSQKLFQDEDGGETILGLDPLPHSAVEQMLKEAQTESTRTDSTTKMVCLSNCSMHGVCTPYGCSCAPGWGGVDCSNKSCPKNCSGNGICVDGSCKCTNGFLGFDCSESEIDVSESGDCPSDCSNNGLCDSFTRQCTCNEGFVGRSCGEERCPNNCMPNGRCADSGRCVCQLGYGGADCSVEICPKSCSGLGVCSSIGCLCYEGSGGVDCSQPQKANHATPFGCASDADCSNRGACESGRCNCNTGFEGDCSELARDIFSAVCKHSSSLYVLAFDSNLQPGIKTW